MTGALGGHRPEYLMDAVGLSLLFPPKRCIFRCRYAELAAGVLADRAADPCSMIVTAAPRCVSASEPKDASATAPRHCHA
jgi:hypothetical protein